MTTIRHRITRGGMAGIMAGEHCDENPYLRFVAAGWDDRSRALLFTRRLADAPEDGPRPSRRHPDLRPRMDPVRLRGAGPRGGPVRDGAAGPALLPDDAAGEPAVPGVRRGPDAPTPAVRRTTPLCGRALL